MVPPLHSLPVEARNDIGGLRRWFEPGVYGVSFHKIDESYARCAKTDNLGIVR